MEQANFITLIGSLATRPEYSHSNHGRRFFAFSLEVARLSGTVDALPILASEALLKDVEVSESACIRVTGQIRSYNSHSLTGRKLIISVYAEKIELCDEPHDNLVELHGTICKQTAYRRTPLGREICDVMLAVNRPYHRADYLPCILWGRAAQDAAYYPVGTPLRLTGRLQSRNYIKLLGDHAEQRTAYEISAISAEVDE